MSAASSLPSKQKKLRFGLLGTGYLAHKTLGAAFQAANRASLVAVADRDHMKAASFSRLFKVEVAADAEALISRADIDAIYISLPNSLHYDWIVAAAAAGKHVICDKPAVLNLNQAKKAVSVCRRAKVRFLEAYAWRFHPQHELVHSLINQGKIGEVRYSEAVFGIPPLAKNNFRYQPSLGGGAINDLAGYGLGAARFLMQGEPIRIVATTFQPKHHRVETRGAALLTFSGGRHAHLVFGFDYAYRNFYAVWGTKGAITVEPAFTIAPAALPKVILATAQGRHSMTASAANQFTAMLDVFAETIIRQSRTSADFESECLKQARAVEKLRQALTR